MESTTVCRLCGSSVESGEQWIEPGILYRQPALCACCGESSERDPLVRRWRMRHWQAERTGEMRRMMPAASITTR